MKGQIALIFICLALSSLPAVSGGKNGKEKTKNISYVEALSVADQFMTAWEWRRQDDGLKLISDSLKNKESEDDLRDYVSGISNPHHEAFEVYSGKKLPDGRISFNVMTYETYTGYPSVYPSGPTLIILSKDAHGKWKVDKLP